jgi:PAS domain-containing protein
MQRFVCEQNIAHFQRLLDTASDPPLRRTLTTLLAAAKRELALLNSAITGADILPAGVRRRRTVDLASAMKQLRSTFDRSPHPFLLLDPGPGLKILDVNDAYARATLTRRDAIAGKGLFEVFPDNPELETADGVSNLFESLRMVVKTGHPNAMAVQRYDVRDGSGEFVEKYWQPINTPIHDDDGRLLCLLHHVEDVTEQVLAARPRPGQTAEPRS